MRVLQIIPTLWVGGAERVAASLATHLKRLGHVSGVICMYDPIGTSVEERLRSEEVRVQYLGKRPGFDPRMVLRIARVLSQFRPDVVHTHLDALKYALPALVAWPRCRVVHTIHNLADKEAGRAERPLQRAAFRLGVVVPVAIGENVAESIRRVYPCSRYRIIANGIQVAEYAPRPGARERTRAELAISGDAPSFLMVARFAPQKDHEGLLRAFASPRLGTAGAHLLLAGDGPRRAAAEELAHALGVRDRVHFLGVRSDVADLLAASDAFVLASHYEGSPLSVMEAMAAGKAVIATRVGCIPELVPENCGRLVTAGDPTALEHALWEFANDRQLARATGTAAARFAHEMFDDAATARAYERLYDELAPAAGARTAGDQ